MVRICLNSVGIDVFVFNTQLTAIADFSQYNVTLNKENWSKARNTSYRKRRRLH